MPQPRTVAVLIGSLRKDSFSRKLAMAFAGLAPDHLAFQTVEYGDLSLFNQDDEATPPAPWLAFRDAIRPADALLFVTPEYNRSVPGALKNAIDVGSRPYGQSVFDGKPGAVISVSPGAMGGFGANHHLRQTLVFLNVPVLSKEAYVGNAAKLFDEAGKIVAPDTTKFLSDYAASFADWIETVRG